MKYSVIISVYEKGKGIIYKLDVWYSKIDPVETATLLPSMSAEFWCRSSLPSNYRHIRCIQTDLWPYWYRKPGK